MIAGNHRARSGAALRTIEQNSMEVIIIAAGDLETNWNLLTVDSSIARPRTGNWDLREGGCGKQKQAGEELHERARFFVGNAV
jgi:hypothetical protein